MVCEISQLQKDKYLVGPLTCDIQNGQIHCRELDSGCQELEGENHFSMGVKFLLCKTKKF
jgi:hypothetical protein